MEPTPIRKITQQFDCSGFHTGLALNKFRLTCIYHDYPMFDAFNPEKLQNHPLNSKLGISQSHELFNK